MKNWKIGKEGEHENKWKGREIGFIAAKPYRKEKEYDIQFWALCLLGQLLVASILIFPGLQTADGIPQFWRLPFYDYVLNSVAPAWTDRSSNGNV